MKYKQISILGRPNVGKSTLFQKLTGEKALVGSTPGTTRDRRTGWYEYAEGQYVQLIDTAGFLEEETDNLQELMNQQAILASELADAIWVMVDAETGPLPLDRLLWQKANELGVPTLLIINKSDALSHLEEAAVFHKISSEFILIGALHQHNLRTLDSWIDQHCPGDPEPETLSRLAVLGRPNAGKSTLCNQLLGEERVIVSPESGTTRDAIKMSLTLKGQTFELVDTAGVRRKSRIKLSLEKDMVYQALSILSRTSVVVVVIDSTIGLTDQDLRLMQHVRNSGSGMIIALNKWDLLDQANRESLFRFTQDFCQQWAPLPILRTSFAQGRGLKALESAIFSVQKSFMVTPNTSMLTRLLEKAIKKYPPPLSKRKTRIKIGFAYPIGYQPLRIKIKGKQLNDLPKSYKRYLERFLIENLKLNGIPILISFANDENPYAKS